MAKENSFDVVSRVDLQEVENAVNQAMKEIQTRFDFKDSVSRIERQDRDLVIVSDDEYKLASVVDILQSKLVKRGVSLKSLRYGKIEPAAGGAVRRRITVQQGIDPETAKQIVKAVKDSKIKVQASVQGDQVRVSGKSKDDLQRVIQLIKGMDLPIDVQFTNFR
ncbi:MAG: YajQ family cyclic di-GMP-binding protein [Alicyclobacillaceae bacterium]|nr:YajQ family cyclic di-GMP-binding protein [Alicyclobacillaceae bacterium]